MREPKIEEVTIRVDVNGGVRAELTCAKCGKKEKTKAFSYEDASLRETGRASDGVFVVRNSNWPKGWESVHVDGGASVDVCGDCVRAWLGGAL